MDDEPPDFELLEELLEFDPLDCELLPPFWEPLEPLLGFELVSAALSDLEAPWEPLEPF